MLWCIGSFLPHQFLIHQAEVLVQELQLGDTETYRNVLLMDSFTFEELLSLVRPQITFHDAHLQEAILAGEMNWFTFFAVHIAAIVLCIHI